MALNDGFWPGQALAPVAATEDAPEDRVRPEADMLSHMTKVLAATALFGFIAFWCTAAIAWFSAIVFAVKAVRRAQPGIKLWGRETLWNPANALLNPQLLTAEGLAYRRKCLIATGVFVACVVVPLLVAAITGALK